MSSFGFLYINNKSMTRDMKKYNEFVKEVHELQSKVTDNRILDIIGDVTSCIANTFLGGNDKDIEKHRKRYNTFKNMNDPNDFDFRTCREEYGQ